MRIILFIYVALLVPARLFGQNRIIDSLKAALNRQQTESRKVLIIDALCQELNRVADYTASFEYARQSLTTAEKINFKKGTALAHRNIAAAIFHVNGNYADAIGHLKTALELFTEIRENKEVAVCHLKIAKLSYQSLSNFPEAIKHSFVALKLFEAENDQKKIAECYRLLGLAFGSQQDTTESLKYSLAALSISGKIKDSVPLAYNCNMIAEIYLGQRRYADALELYSKALSIYEGLAERGPDFGIPWTYAGFGYTYEAMGNDAVEHGNKAEARPLFNLALGYFERRFNYEQERNMPHGDTYSNLGGIYRSLSKVCAENQRIQYLALSRSYYEKDLDIALKNSIREMTMEIYRNLVIVDTLCKDYAQGFWDYSNYIKYRDSLLNDNNSKKSAMYQMQFEFDKKEALEKAVREKKEMMQRNIRNSIAAGLVIALLFSVIVFRQRNRMRKEKLRAEEERKRSDALLLNILPLEVAEEIKAKGSVEARHFDQVTVLFTDFKDFTVAAEQMSAQELVNEINLCYSEFDRIVSRHGLEKIKTIGDSYMCAGGIPIANTTHAEDCLNAAFEIRNFMAARKSQDGNSKFEIRIGMHSGPVVAGIVGIKKFAYDIWGDTVNIAARMEQNSEAGKINISESTYELLRGKYSCDYRGRIKAKNKGEIDMYFVEPVSQSENFS